MNCASFSLILLTVKILFSDALPVQEIETSPESLDNLFEGDIVLNEEFKFRLERNGLPSKKWMKSFSGFVSIPYKISAKYSLEDKQLIKSALLEIENVSCVRFHPRATETDYIEFVSNVGCSSMIGRQGGRQTITLASSRFKSHCMDKGSAIHEVLHALGFYHMQSSIDRDDYVKVNYENIKSGMESNFYKYKTSRFDTNYDIESIMHYGSNFFSRNGKPTLEPLDKTIPLSTLGQRKRMTNGDVQRLNSMYQCSNVL